MTPDTDAPADGDKPATQREGEVLVEASQLQPGVHVRLPVGWMSHPFMRNSFVISSEDEVRQIASLKLPQMFCDLSRCTSPPLAR